MTIEEILREAIETGEVIDIIYVGGSQPGASRKISPIKISDGKVRARCISSGTVKSFLMSKILLPNDCSEKEIKQRVEGLKKEVNFTSLLQFIEYARETLIGQGWHINSSDTSLSLHGYFKNGKPKKGEDLSLDYEEYTYDLVATDDGDFVKENIRKSQRPWAVRAKNIDTRTYGTLDKASETFMEWSKQLSLS